MDKLLIVDGQKGNKRTDINDEYNANRYFVF
jgi:hypothetical protein